MFKAHKMYQNVAFVGIKFENFPGRAMPPPQTLPPWKGELGNTPHPFPHPSTSLASRPRLLTGTWLVTGTRLLSLQVTFNPPILSEYLRC